MEPLTVAQLIELLHKMPQDTVVMIEGCDCYGFAGGVVLDENTGTVDIIRTEDGHG